MRSGDTEDGSEAAAIGVVYPWGSLSWTCGTAAAHAAASSRLGGGSWLNSTSSRSGSSEMGSSSRSIGAGEVEGTGCGGKEGLGLEGMIV